jgi:vacuolar protein sorting-associated protein VTA1
VEKTRYAKWRAAEISKALREGRQPTPAPASAEPEPAETALDSVSAPPEPFTGLIDAPAPSVHFSHELEEPHSISAMPLVSTSFGEEDTPLEIPPASAPAPINASDVQAQHIALSVSPSPPSSASMPLPHQVDAKAPTEAALPSIALYDSPADMVQGQEQDYLTSIDAVSMTQSPTLAQHPSSPTHLVPQDSPPTAPYLAGGPYASAPPLPPPPSAPYTPYIQIPRQPLPPPPPPPPPETSAPPELTPGLIAKTQKHCRFAISALDYEDVEQARKELRAALAILGG